MNIFLLQTNRSLVALEARPRTFHVGLRVELFEEIGYCDVCDKLHRREGLGMMIYLIALVVKLAFCYKVEDISHDSDSKDEQVGSN